MSPTMTTEELKKSRILPLLIPLLVVGLFAITFLAGMTWQQSQRADRLEEDLGLAESDVDNLAETVDDVVRQAANKGVEVTVPDTVEGIQQARDGSDGRDGRDGRDGQPGRAPTADEVQAAVVAYCATGACKGEPGVNGINGTNGTDGEDPTAEEVAAAVSAYCADGRCQGTPGSDGQDGVDGAPGPAPASFTFSTGGPGLTRTYNCTDPDGDTHYECAEQTEVP